MTDNLIPLAIWPHDIPDEQMDLIRQAKAALNLPFRVLPSPAVPGSPTRVLGMGSLPPFLCDCALVNDPTNPESVENALRWLLTAPEGDDRGFMALDYLNMWFGPGVTWSHVEPAPDMKGPVFQ